MVNIKFKIVLKNGSIYTCSNFEDDGVFLKFVDIKGTERWVNKESVSELNKIVLG